MNCDNKFWLESPKNLLCEVNVIPKSFMSLEEQMNCLSRLIISMFIILYLVNYPNSILFLLLSLTVIIILYYSKKNMIENYVQNPHTILTDEYIIASEKRKQSACSDLKKKYSVNRMTFYTPKVQDLVQTIPNQLFQSKNQNLVGGANPKTRIAPVTVAPIYEWNVWKQNDFVIPQAINSRTSQDFYSSGYHTEDCDPSEETVEGFSEYQKQPKFSGAIDVSYGYDKKNLEYDLPVNYNPSSDQKNKDLNREIFTSTVVPGVYYKNEIIEPINSNIGISFDQQIPPMKTEKLGKNTTFVAVDPYDYTPSIKPAKKSMFPSTYDVFDPRYNGYGTEYRGYNEKMTGQGRFYYDDVNAIRRPNYIGKSNIDHLESSYTYGPTLSDEDIVENNKNSRKTVEMAFRDQTLEFREGMMTSLMRKKNAEQWQNRLAPRSRAGAFTMGGMGLH